VDLEVTGIREGSTVIELAAPTLGSAAPDPFGSRSLWTEPPDLDDTALDLASRAVREIVGADASGDLFDDAVLDAAKRLATALPDEGARWKLSTRDSARPLFTISDAAKETMERRLAEIPDPQTRVVSGRLDEIGHRRGEFRLEMDSGPILRGKIVRDAMEVESLRGLWGHEATVTGEVHFKLDTTPRRIEAHRIVAPHAGDVVFRSLPTGAVKGGRSLFGASEISLRRSNPLPRFEEEWPGAETLPELVADLD